jgi:hypothetical protein
VKGKIPMKTRRGTETIIAKALVVASAVTEYKAKSQKVRGLLSDLDKALTKHDKRQATNPTDWGYVGDLGNVIEKLAEALRFLNSGN